MSDPIYAMMLDILYNIFEVFMISAIKNSKVIYLVDEQGRRTAAQINIDEYERLIEYIEDLEDLLTIEELSKRKPEYREYSEIRDELVTAGLL